MPSFPAPSELFILGFEAERPPRAQLARFARGDYAGLIFFTRNFPRPDDPLAIAAQLRELDEHYRPFGELDEIPPIYALDYEGGRVQRIRAPLTAWPPMAALRTQPPEVAEAVGAAMGYELAILGFNVSFAPVLDVATNPENPIIGDRAFGVEPAGVAERALAYLRGLERSECMRGCGKHYPGHGDTHTDSHLTLPVVTHDEARLRAVELAPFAAAVRAGIGMLMTAHVVYPAIDARPATLSRRWLTDILRGELGYDGVIVSDDLDMKAVSAAQLGALLGVDGPQAEIEDAVVVESLLAGCDAFLLCRDPDRQVRAEEALIRAAEKRSDVRDRLYESQARLRRFRQTLSPCAPDEVELKRVPLPAHEALRRRLLG